MTPRGEALYREFAPLCYQVHHIPSFSAASRHAVMHSSLTTLADADPSRTTSSHSGDVKEVAASLPAKTIGRAVESVKQTNSHPDIMTAAWIS
jgi:hypothetical protein